MLIPLQHDNMTARRWPVITIALIAINTLVFLATNERMQREQPELREVKAHVLILAARYPDLKLTSEEQTLVNNFRKRNESVWKQAQSFNAPIVDAWDARIRLVEDTDKLQAEMDSLGQRYADLLNTSFVEHYAFVPAHPEPVSYLTANFLHGGWLHLIGNMWFLWLAGFVLEDAWGRPLYIVFYLVAGAAALQIHALVNAGSIVPCVGASGAVAALMGAFLVRFPKLKIHMAWLFLFRLYRFKAEAYWLLPLWLLMELFYGSLFGSSSGVAHWAHVGGFVFGAAAAAGISFSGLEKKASEKVDAQLDPDGARVVDQANESLQHGRLDDAVNLVQATLAHHPDSVDALNVLREAHYRRGETDQYLEVSVKLCTIYLKRHAPEAALQAYEEFLNAGGNKLPETTWLSLARGLEDAQMFDRALAEYEALAAAYPNAAQSILAQIGAARIFAKRLGRPQDALRFLQAAESSPVPHLDMEQSIRLAMKEATAMLGTKLQPQTSKTAIVGNR